MKPTKVPTSFITSLVRNESRLVFVPNVGNLGDGLIAHATYTFLLEAGLHTSIALPSAEVHDSCVLLGGGGNLIEGRYTDLADFLTRCGRYNRIVVLPHTILGYQELLLSLPNVAILARDGVTFSSLLSAGFPEERLFLADDMAMYLAGRVPQPHPSPPRERLFCLRGDSESAGLAPPPTGNVDVSALMFNCWADPAIAQLASMFFLGFLSQYESIVTDRLHVAIGGHLLNRPVGLIPNAYFKNRAVYELSLADAQNVSMIEAKDTPDLLRRLASPFPSNTSPTVEGPVID